MLQQQEHKETENLAVKVLGMERCKLQRIHAKEAAAAAAAAVAAAVYKHSLQ
jgi:hypothetical protein